jgi:hypothetical protein
MASSSKRPSTSASSKTVGALTTDQQDKRARVLSLSHGSYVSHRGLEYVIDQVRRHGVPEASSRTTQMRYRSAAARRGTSYGPLVRDFTLPLVEDNGESSSEIVSIQDPFAMMHVAATECPTFGKYLLDACRQHPSDPQNPWGLIVYADEIGHNPLLSKDPRKVQAIYYSYAELGARMLSTESGWFVLTTIRSNLVDKIASGMSHLVRILLREAFFNDASGHNFATAGVTVTIGGVTVVIFARLKVIIGDEKSLKEIFGFKGASGFKLCPGCQLVCSHKTKDAKLGRNVRSTCLEVRKFCQHTNASILLAVRELRDLARDVVAGRAAYKALELMEYHYGFNDIPLGILSDTDLCSSPRDMLFFDWYHIWVVNGIYQKECQALTTYLLHSKIKMAPMVKRFLSEWTWPRHISAPSAMFDEFDQNADHLKIDGHTCTASYEVLAVFITVMILPLRVNAPQCESFLKMCDCMDLILSAKHGMISSDMLMDATLTFLAAHLAAYGDRSWVPKHHYALHLAIQLSILGVMIGCNIHEIRHKLAKRWARDRFSQRSFEQGCIEEITLQHLHDMQHNWLVDGLINPAKPRAYLLESMHAMFGDDVEVLTAGEVHVNCRQFHAGDFAFAHSGGDGAILVRMEFHVSIDSVPHTCVSLFVPAPGANDTTWCRKYKSANASKMISSSKLLTSVTYLERGASISAIVPALVRMNGMRLC